MERLRCGAFIFKDTNKASSSGALRLSTVYLTIGADSLLLKLAASSHPLGQETKLKWTLPSGLLATGLRRSYIFSSALPLKTVSVITLLKQVTSIV